MGRLSQEIPRRRKFSKLKGGKMVSVRDRNRCPRCGRPRSFMRKFQLCRVCFRGLALRGDIPGVIKSSW